MMRIIDSDEPPSLAPRSTVDEEAQEVAEADSRASTADEDPEEGTAEQREARPGSRGRAGARTWLVVALVAALAGGGGFLGWQLLALRADNAARAEALAAAERYATDLSSYDFRDLRGNFTAVEANATGAFGDQYREVSKNLTELIKQHEAVSKGNVVSAGVVEADTGKAVVVLFVDQTITNTNSPQPRIDRNRMRMTLVHAEDRWLVDDVALL